MAFNFTVDISSTIKPAILAGTNTAVVLVVNQSLKKLIENKKSELKEKKDAKPQKIFGELGITDFLT